MLRRGRRRRRREASVSEWKRTLTPGRRRPTTAAKRDDGTPSIWRVVVGISEHSSWAERAQGSSPGPCVLGRRMVMMMISVARSERWLGVPPLRSSPFVLPLSPVRASGRRSILLCTHHMRKGGGAIMVVESGEIRRGREGPCGEVCGETVKGQHLRPAPQPEFGASRDVSRRAPVCVCVWLSSPLR